MMFEDNTFVYYISLCYIMIVILSYKTHHYNS